MTNDKAIKALVKALDKQPVQLGFALLRERILKIMEITMESIEENPEAWQNPFIHPDMYKSLNEIVQEHLAFKD
jgi:hypothetical protein